MLDTIERMELKMFDEHVRFLDKHATDCKQIPELFEKAKGDEDHGINDVMSFLPSLTHLLTPSWLHS